MDKNKHLPENMKRVKLAIVFLDIIASTAYVQKYGAVTAARLFQYHDSLTRSLIYKFDGREIDRSDGFLCSFIAPIDAVNFALAYQKTIPKKTKLRCRIGIHWDEIVEVQQKDMYVLANAKRVELEGIAKNIAARTMSICEANQVLVTGSVYSKIRHRSNRYTPKTTLFACAGMYKFKGVKDLQKIYILTEDIDALKPPIGNEKAKRIAGPKEIRIRAKNRKLKHWYVYFRNRLAVASSLYLLYLFFLVILNPESRKIFNIYSDFLWLDKLIALIISILTY